MDIVVFTIADKVFGADIRQVRQVIRTREITSIPDTAPFVEGVISLRRKVVPLINLKKKFRFQNDVSKNHQRIIITHIHGRVTGILVDDVSDVESIGAEAVSAPDEVLKDAHYLTGVVTIRQRMVLLIDMDKILDSKDKEHLDKVGAQVEVR